MHTAVFSHLPPSSLHCSTLRRESSGGYVLLLLECCQLLLVLGSSVLYSPSARGQLGQHPYLDAAMRQRDLANGGEQRGGRECGRAGSVSIATVARVFERAREQKSAVHCFLPLSLPP